MTTYEIAKKIADWSIEVNQRTDAHAIRNFLDDGEAMVNSGITDDDQDSVEDLYDMANKLISFDDNIDPIRALCTYYQGLYDDDQRAFEIIYAMDAQAKNNDDPSLDGYGENIDFFRVFSTTIKAGE